MDSKKETAENKTPKEAMEALISAYAGEKRSLAAIMETTKKKRTAAKVRYNTAMEAIYGAYLRKEAEEPNESDPGLNAEFRTAYTLVETAEKEMELIHTAQIVLDESLANAAAAIVMETWKADPETWLKYPLRYKKFRKLFRQTFGDAADISQYAGTTYLEIEELSQHALLCIGEELRMKDIEDWRPREVYAPGKILKETREAMSDRESLLREYKELRERAEKIAGKYIGRLRKTIPLFPELH